MRPIARQPYAQRRPPGSRSFPDQNRGFHPQSRTGRDTRGSSVSVVENLVTCKLAAQDRTLPFHSNRQVGTFNLITGHHTTETTIRETLRRPGPHPHRSIRTSLDPLVIFMHHIDSNRSITGYYDHTYSSTFEFMYRNMHVNRGSGSCGITGGVFTGR